MSSGTPSPGQDKPNENDTQASDSPQKNENEAEENGSIELPLFHGPEEGTKKYEIKELKRMTVRLERSLPKPEGGGVDPKTPIRRQGFLLITPTLTQALKPTLTQTLTPTLTQTLTPTLTQTITSTPTSTPTSTQDSRTVNTKIEHKWSQNETKVLLDFYNKYHTKVGTYKIPNIKMLWELIAAELGNLNIHVSSSNCINRWKVLERNYKKFVYNQNKTGRGRRHFEYEEEMRDIFGNKNSIHPEIINPEMLHPEIILNTEAMDNIDKVPEVQETTTITDDDAELPKTIETVKSSQKTDMVLKKIRLDRKDYYKSKLEIEHKKLEQIKRRNDLMEERNLIMKERNKLLQDKKICSCSIEEMEL